MMMMMMIIYDRQSNAISVATVGLYLQHLYVEVSEVHHSPSLKNNALAKNV
jgi:hypothetical protein